MTKYIKVTGLIHPDDLGPGEVDLSHDMGLSEDGYETLTRQLTAIGVDDARFELVDE